MEEILLRDYVNEITVSPHVSEGGMFGMGEAFSLFGILLLASFTIYVYGAIKYKRDHGKWLRPDRYYFKEILKGFSALFFSIAGRPVPVRFIDSSDGRYADLSIEDMEDCVQWAYSEMRRAGVTYKEMYKWRVFDCEDFAGTMKDLCAKRYADKYWQTFRGAPFGLFGYSKRKGDKHVCLKALGGGKIHYYEVYPEYAGKLKLTDKEIESVDLELF